MDAREFLRKHSLSYLIRLLNCERDDKVRLKAFLHLNLTNVSLNMNRPFSFVHFVLPIQI